LNEYEIYRLGIGRKFQTPTVYIDHTVFENLLLSLEGPRGVWASLFSRVKSEQTDRIHEILKTINLSERANWKAGRSRTDRNNGSRSECSSRRMPGSCW
jgi:urea transport system ATP-binding protein